MTPKKAAERILEHSDLISWDKNFLAFTDVAREYHNLAPAVAKAYLEAVELLETTVDSPDLYCGGHKELVEKIWAFLKQHGGEDV